MLGDVCTIATLGDVGCDEVAISEKGGRGAFARLADITCETI
jgi:hypothetical protein